MSVSDDLAFFLFLSLHLYSPKTDVGAILLCVYLSLKTFVSTTLPSLLHLSESLRQRINPSHIKVFVGTVSDAFSLHFVRVGETAVLVAGQDYLSLQLWSPHSPQGSPLSSFRIYSGNLGSGTMEESGIG